MRGDLRARLTRLEKSRGHSQKKIIVVRSREEIPREKKRLGIRDDEEDVIFVISAIPRPGDAVDERTRPGVYPVKETDLVGKNWRHFKAMQSPEFEKNYRAYKRATAGDERERLAAEVESLERELAALKGKAGREKDS